MSSSRQLLMPFLRTRRHLGGEFLRAASNEAAVRWLQQPGAWPQHRLALWGEEGCGKTSLVHDWAGRNSARVLSGAVLPAVGDFAGALGAGAIAIDDAEPVCAEVTLLHLLNAASEARVPVLLAARRPPARWTVRLADLASRLRAITAVEIGHPEESLLRGMLARLLAERQQRVSPETQDWLLTRLPRVPAVLREAVDRLDRAAVARPGGITLPLARLVLADLLAPEVAQAEEAVRQNSDEYSVSSAQLSSPMLQLL